MKGYASMSLTAAALWLNTFFAAFDQSVTSAIHQLYYSAGGILTPIMEFVSFLGHDGLMLILFSIVLILYKKTRRFGIAMLLSLAVGALITNLVVKVAVARPRPYADPNGFFYPIWLEMGQHMESDMSFPSGHTTAAFAFSMAIFLVGDKRISWTALFFGVLMGISRIYLVVHYPSDVIGGIIIGVGSGFVGTYLVRFIPDAVFEMNNYFLKKGRHSA